MPVSRPASRPTGASTPRTPGWHRWWQRFTATTTVLLGSLLAGSPAYADVPTPNAVQPPGTDGVNTVVNWAFWMASIACFVGFLGVAATMAIKHRRGEGAESLSWLGGVLGACVILAAAVPITNALT